MKTNDKNKQLIDPPTSYDAKELLVQKVGWETPAQKQTPALNDTSIDEILNLAKKFIAIPSVSGDIDKSVEILALAKEQLPGYMFTPFVSNSFPSLLYTNIKDEKHFKIILNAHLDVVPGAKKQYTPYEKDGKLYGRGAYDMKATAAIMILLFKELANKVSYPLGLQLVTEEEMVGEDGTAYQVANGITADFAIMGECGSNLDIIYESKGVISAKITTHGYSAHGAYLWQGKNAILKMYDAINSLHKHFPIPKKETDLSTINISKITTSNETWNQVPDNCTATLDIRFNSQDANIIVTKIKSILPDDVTFEVESVRNHNYTDPKNEYVEQLSKLGEKVIGKKLVKRKTFGGSDTMYFSNVGCSAVEFGPVGYGQHNENEWIDIKSLGDYYQILKTFLLSVK